jgi:precorrin-2 dehydrogenase/sirohydrochlorin ferrochelatase
MPGFPIELDLRGREALVVGPWPEAARKVEQLLEAGATVTILLEAPAPELEALAGRARVESRRATDEDRTGKAVVLVAPWSTAEDEARARRWSAAALRDGTLLCSLDRPETSTFTNVAIARAGGLTITVSSGGASPGLARRVREDLEAIFAEPRFARFLARLAELRAALPRGERAGPMGEAVRGFALRGGLVFPAWFERDEGREE